jgi:hypothetical protein
MKLVRVFVASLAITGIASSGFAGDLQQSIAKAVSEQEQVKSGPVHIDKEYLIPGAALFVAGLSMAVYGFLHTTGGEFVEGQVSKESNTALGGAGLAVAGAGGAILFWGAHHSKAAPSVSVGRRGVTVVKRLTW